MNPRRNEQGATKTVLWITWLRRDSAVTVSIVTASLAENWHWIVEFPYTGTLKHTEELTLRGLQGYVTLSVVWSATGTETGNYSPSVWVEWRTEELLWQERTVQNHKTKIRLYFGDKTSVLSDAFQKFWIICKAFERVGDGQKVMTCRSHNYVWLLFHAVPMDRRSGNVCIVQRWVRQAN
jgi:hypothetical protein